ncbi:MAG: hypothetical protein GXY83_24385 [Rhodopirellula sp.]|nr:hypothetical protein [Rhodopirellula sp.]
MRITKLTSVGFCLNGALGSGKYDDISIAEVKKRIEQGDVFNYLESVLGHDVDLTLLSPGDKAELLKEWQDLALAVDEGRKMCVDRNGLCLLVAYLLEGIQRRQDHNEPIPGHRPTR